MDNLFFLNFAPLFPSFFPSFLYSVLNVLFCFSNKSDAIKAGFLFSPENTSIYKPWSNFQTDWTQVAAVVLVPPFPWTDTIYITAVKNDIFQQSPEIEFAIQNSIKLPFAVEAGITRGIYNLISELPLRQEKDWFIYDTVLTKYFERKGPYLFPKIPEDKYDDFILHCLDCGILINPSYNQPSLIPLGADKGVFTKLKNNPF